MFLKSFRWAAVVALPVAATLGGAPASAQDDSLLTVPPAAGNLSGINQFCIDMFSSGQQPRVPFESRRDNAVRDENGVELVAPTITELTTASGVAVFPENPDYPNGDSYSTNPSNLIPTVYENIKSCRGNEIINTLPSTPDNPYNLHDDPVVTEIDKTSPTDDLDFIMDRIHVLSKPRKVCRNFRGRQHCYRYPRRVSQGDLRRLARHAVNIIEGNELQGRYADRAYEGFPLLHYLGGLKEKAVDPVTRSVTVNQIWYDTHIESDTAYIDPIAVDDDDEWYIKYNVKILNRGHEDFAPYMMVYDDPLELDLSDVGGPDLTQAGLAVPRIPNVGLDQTFFPMEEGLMYTLNMKMPPARFWNLTYHWGWRIHPPRVQVVENVRAVLATPNGPMPRNFAEIAVFGENPRESEASKLAAIEMIGDTAPAKRMWRMFRELGNMTTNRRPGRYFRGLNGSAVQAQLAQIREAFYDWSNRTQLPTGYEMGEGYDMTVLFLNNTIYGQLRDHDGIAQVSMSGRDVWDKRGDEVKIQLLNGDYFRHAYVLVDFGGLRGWENTFHNTLPVGGAGPLFTFGRNAFWIHVAGRGAIPIPNAVRPEQVTPTPLTSAMDQLVGFKKGNHHWTDALYSAMGGTPDTMSDYVNTDGVGEHSLNVIFSYEPSRRLRMYQFDALHHDTAVWSVH
ncbi:hypothetical protein SAMN04487859_11374 [Roseovarius lutimaris]|uniref:Uncharacterized protein n=2 Tax=Roseovarius lutimaris TaxID=1005928 RepID=A0A1I5DSV8_9RHOB|nr:hypothetical protein SAMN04487859_11374 [Roseovarius lutimaris]